METNKELPVESQQWQLKSHEDDDAGYWEITNGPISICTSEDPVDESVLPGIVNLLNKAQVKFRSENKLELDQQIQIMQLQHQIESLSTWKAEQMALTLPLIEWGQGNKNLKLGESIYQKVLEFALKYEQEQQARLDLKFERDEISQEKDNLAFELRDVKDKAELLFQTLQYVQQTGADHQLAAAAVDAALSAWKGEAQVDDERDENIPKEGEL